jgi:hypothetical protein
MALAYIDARNVMERLDSVCGPSNWKDTYERDEKGVMCCLSLRIGDEWIGKTDGAEPSDIEGYKGAVSDAFKRAAVKWGIGRYLYALDAPWVSLDQGKYIAKSELPRLAASLGGNARQAKEKPATGPSGGKNTMSTAEADEFGKMLAGLIKGQATTDQVHNVWEKNLEEMSRLPDKHRDRLLEIRDIHVEELKQGSAA